MKRFLAFILAFLFTQTWAAGIPLKPQTDTFQLGKSGSTESKEIVIDTGDGASNPKITVDTVNKDFDLNKTLNITGNLDATGTGAIGGNVTVGGNSLTLGDGTTSEKFFSFDVGGEDVGFKFDPTKNEILQKRKVGDTYKPLGSGSGSGGGENYNNAFTADNNANAEDGTASWTASAGTFTTDTADPLEGEQSFVWTPAAQNDTNCSALLDFDKDIFKGRSCEASIEYIGGDENLQLQVIDGNGDILNPHYSANVNNDNRTLRAQTISAPYSVSFRCPTAADITADALNGDIKLCLVNTGASAAAQIKWDKSYSGTLQALSESVLPDTMSARIDGSDGSVLNDDAGFVDSCTKDGTGTYTCSLSGFSVFPLLEVKSTNSNRSCAQSTQSSTSVTVQCFSVQGSGAANDSSFILTAHKQGADAKQSVQVVTSIPKVSENVNEFTAQASSDGSISDENIDFINGNCSETSAGIYECDFVGGIFSSIPVITPTIKSGSGSCDGDARVLSASTTSFTVNTFESVGTGASCPFSLVVSRTKDYKMPVKQYIIAGQVENSYSRNSSKQVRTERCIATNNGTATMNSSLCSSWLDSVSRIAPGQIQYGFKSNVFSENPACTCTTSGGNATCTQLSVSTSQVTFLSDNLSGTDTDLSQVIDCTGVR